MQLKQPPFPTSPLTAAIKTACSALALTACLTAASVQAADQGTRHHARGEYDTVTATYVVVEGDDLFAVSERFEIPAEDLKAQNQLSSNELKPGQKLSIASAASPATTPARRAGRRPSRHRQARRTCC